VGIINIPDIFKDIETGCECGKEHRFITKEIYIGKDACTKMAEFIANNYGANANKCIVCDKNTLKASRKLIDELDLKRKGGETFICDAEPDSFHADMGKIERARERIKNLEFDFFIAAGSGTVHDITRVLAHELNKPFISFPTAPSVDGFVSNVAPVTDNGMKITLYSASPVALFADTEIICGAPKRLAASGAGDILGKYVALADWRIANLLLGEYICGKIIELEYAAVNKTRESINAFSLNPDDLSYEKLCVNLLEALIISGLCMQVMGNSRPASGAEHHIAHFFEMGVLASSDCLHGENVGIGSILCADIYHKFAGTPDADIIFARNPKKYEPDYDLVKTYYKDLFDEIEKQANPNELIKITPEIFYGKIGEIKSIIAEIPSKDEFIKLLRAVSGITDLNQAVKAGTDDIGRIAELSLTLAPYVRNRFTLLKLMRLIEF
jgi:glycerol-1-phosphate dehydrogenase [NAD(P)+]